MVDRQYPQPPIELQPDPESYLDADKVNARGVRVVELAPGMAPRGSDTDGVVASPLPPFDGGTPSEGDTWVYRSGVWVFEQPTGAYERLFRSSADSAVITNTTAETAYSTASHTIAANTLAAGDELKAGFDGIYSTQGFTNGQMTIRLKAGSVVLATLGVVNAADTMPKYFKFQVNVEVRSIGASGSLVTTVPTRIFGNGLLKDTNRVVSTVDTTAAIQLQLTAQWAVANAGNSTKLHYAAYDRIKA